MFGSTLDLFGYPSGSGYRLRRQFKIIPDEPFGSPPQGLHRRISSSAPVTTAEQSRRLASIAAISPTDDLFSTRMFASRIFYDERFPATR